ncbi:pilus assembly protein TadG-related protein [Roseomonas xinghualingensis]|uniref:pilus assembly protein TadG-related protein n=1 Tax=Roseomonas xinghualingensis TaxID=2986475 RepID=UPI0021F20D5A|nr:pilus assembly protein TadG-related protein [Roseomonas sp. SXEYE001]MCV4208705.1 pilus assembly protein TadG-related protein [Roseomonas sp. SXEYE001]
MHPLPTARLRPAAERLRRDRRGATAILFALSGTALLGAIALAADGGLLYLTHRRAQSAADTAAIAAASAAETRTKAAALAAAGEVAQLNGFRPGNDTTFAVRSPPASGPHQGNDRAYEVEITRRQPLSLAGALFRQPEADIRVRAVATLLGTMQVCMLALNGSVSFSNYGQVEARGCGIGANGTGSNAVNISANGGRFSAQGVMTAGSCTGCTGRNVTLTEGYQNNAPRIANPYQGLDSLQVPDPPCSTSTNTSFNSHVEMPAFEQTGTAFCNKAYAIGQDSKVELDPGTYIFRNASLTISSLSQLRCTGCTFILVGTGTGTPASFSAQNLSSFICDDCTIALLGSRPGQVSFTSLSSARITAPRVNRYDARLNGMIITRANAVGSGSPALSMSNLSSIELAGGIYVPNGHAKISNMSAPNPSSCLPFVVGSLEVGQLSNFPFDTSGCAGRNTAVPEIKVPRLVE